MVCYVCSLIDLFKRQFKKKNSLNTIHIHTSISILVLLFTQLIYWHPHIKVNTCIFIFLNTGSFLQLSLCTEFYEFQKNFFSETQLANNFKIKHKCHRPLVLNQTAQNRKNPMNVQNYLQPAVF